MEVPADAWLENAATPARRATIAPTPTVPSRTLKKTNIRTFRDLGMCEASYRNVLNAHSIPSDLSITCKKTTRTLRAASEHYDAMPSRSSELCDLSFRVWGIQQSIPGDYLAFKHDSMDFLNCRQINPAIAVESKKSATRPQFAHVLPSIGCRHNLSWRRLLLRAASGELDEGVRFPHGANY